LKTYKSTFAGIYDGFRFKNNIFQTDDENVQKTIESSYFFKIGEIILLNTLKTHTELSGDTIDYEDMPMYSLRKIASEKGFKISPSTKKAELIKILKREKEGEY
jgi:hypothetical protein